MKFVAAGPALIALWGAGRSVDAIFASPLKNVPMATLSKSAGWLMKDALRGGSMGK